MGTRARTNVPPLVRDGESVPARKLHHGLRQLIPPAFALFARTNNTVTGSMRPIPIIGGSHVGNR
ncbi:hypothetical protein GCM10009541_00270 [Micromonospora gifhornensis]|uniref:Uncharacterized protein n=1 Tax=Micromonospora gifhornensis TaxID=84594 RepID=A0ABQ4IJP0_9ACTN|nr:hypothetical protein Vgi01_47350 [Micromonospora gifhornensis]